MSFRHFATRAVRAGSGPEDGADVAPPIHLSTTFKRDEALRPLSAHTYARESNPNLERLERAFAGLEGGEAALAFASGLAAATTLLQSIPAGSRILLPSDGYYQVHAVLADYGARWGFTVEEFDPAEEGALGRALDRPAGLVWLESPSNPLLVITDLADACARARAAGAVTMVDNTFATPALQRPLELGADVAFHSTTKYCGGHSDAMGGALVFASRTGLAEDVARARDLLGGVPAPFSSWLTERGLRTLAVRMEAHSRNAVAVARFLSTHPAVERVNYPGLPSHPGHETARRQMPEGCGGMLSFHTRGGREAAMRAVGRARLFVRATSLGSVESLIEHRATAEGPRGRAPQDLIRLSVGIEHPEDLIADLEQALGEA
jgi:cystathionine gamma-synthase